VAHSQAAPTSGDTKAARLGASPSPSRLATEALGMALPAVTNRGVRVGRRLGIPGLGRLAALAATF
jgi:hypothetical protein